MKLNQEPDLEVVWQAGSLKEAHGIHLDGIDLAVVDPVLLGGDDGMVLVREVAPVKRTGSRFGVLEERTAHSERAVMQTVCEMC